ncbi:MAG TPA: opacity family porin [Caulobacteraceae bacterium]|nr:opacity family porin [Caulobacteraceae bacterium]
MSGSRTGWIVAATLSAAAFVAPGAALADDPNDPSTWAPPKAGLYLALDLGYHWPLTIQGTSIRPAPDGQPYVWNYKLNSDWASFGRVGWRFSPHFRLEFDGGLRESNIHSIQAPGTDAGGLVAGRPAAPFQLCDHTTAPPPCAAIGRPHINWAYADDGMINAIYDFDSARRLQPFVGVGLGIYHLQFDAHYFYSAVPGPITATNPATQQMQLGGSIFRLSEFAYQAVGGVSYRVKRRLWLDTTVRYISAPFLRWNTINDTAGLNGAQGIQPGDFHGDSQDVSVTMGVRYSL